MEKVNQETTAQIWNILSRIGSQNALNASTVQKLIQLSFTNFERLTNNQVHPNDLSLLPNVEAMYTTIWSDNTKNEKKKRWASIKKTTVEKGPPSGPDLKILATTAKLAKDGIVELLTFDYDFILFADEIMSTFGISIKNGWVSLN